MRSKRRMDRNGQVFAGGFSEKPEKVLERVASKNKSREARTVCDENGVVIADEERVMNRWKEYFEGLWCGCSWGGRIQ